MKKIDNKQYIWPEKYAPKLLEDMILPKKIRNQFETYIKDETIPNLLICGTQPGIGKSSIVHTMIDELDADSMWLNGSGNDRGIDSFNTEIPRFAYADIGLTKMVVIDECLEENQEIIIGTIKENMPLKLKELEIGTKYNCISFNATSKKLENDTCEVVSYKDEEVFEVELDDGRKITLTETHPFIVKDNDGNISKRSLKDGLDGYEIIDSFDVDVADIEEEYKDVTVRFTKSQADILEKSGVNLEHLLRSFLENVVEEVK